MIKKLLEWDEEGKKEPSLNELEVILTKLMPAEDPSLRISFLIKYY